MSDRIATVPAIAGSKVRSGSRPLVMVTAYDAPGARIADDGGVDMILVGDSVAMAVLGMPDTLGVRVRDIAHHVAAVRRAQPRALVVADLPWLSYHRGRRRAVEAAGKLVRAGAQAVKLEGGRERLDVIDALVRAQIPVMGHLGLTPQSANVFGGMVVQGRSIVAAERILADAMALEQAGVFAMVLEGIPAPIASVVTARVGVPTIGIGAGAGCDGQVLVFHDLLGFADGHRPRFVKTYAELGAAAREAVAAWAKDVTEGAYPDDAHAYRASTELAAWAERQLTSEERRGGAPRS
ncbi:3-methyl-2-oxobutanoate hydroxymethyltransferase [Acidimicrobium ferrooxidans]|nr:3-methyl-2-oxobutanoate hydroxymethyltransferase [Acidimicrobium ferrooxidans]